jgi:hypothetical protein
MAQLPAELANRIASAQVTGGGNYIQHGDYVLMVRKWFFQKIQDECIITEFLVGDARKKTVFEGARAVDVDPNQEGADVSEPINFGGNGKLSAGSNAKAVVLGLFGFKQGEVPDHKVAETLISVTSDTQPATGMLIGLSTYPKEKVSKPGEFITGRNWICIDKPGTGLNSPENVKARLDALLVSPDAAVKLIKQQLKSRSAATTPSIPTIGLAAVPSIPSIPTPPKNSFEGWTAHPQDPNQFFKDNGKGGFDWKSKAELENTH